MGSNGTKRNTGKPNIDAEDKIDGKPIYVETPAKDPLSKHRFPNSSESRRAGDSLTPRRIRCFSSPSVAFLAPMCLGKGGSGGWCTYPLLIEYFYPE